MTENVRYHPLFESDVVAAANWYDERSPGLGDSFIMNVRHAAETVIGSPKRHGKPSQGLRYSRVDRFPYYVLFDLAGDELLFLGVLHTSRSIEKWLGRRK